MATPFYNGNMNLKSIGVPVSYTPEQVKEYMKCKNDPIYFMETYCNITSIDLGNTLFKMHQYQKDLVNAIHNNRFTIAKCGRQLGKCCEKTTLLTIRNKTTGKLVDGRSW
jgi:hypothetical protein